jgi:transcriptional regulator with XRE-family HTH domain
MARLSEPDVCKALFAARLVAVRKDRGWSQETLSFESGLARSYLSGIERGLRNISLDNICRLAGTLGVKPSVFLDFEVEMEQED